MPKLDSRPAGRLTAVSLTLLAGALLACAAAMPPEAAARDEAVEQAELDCTTLDEVACLESADCTLRQSEDKAYACTPAASACERGFLQRPGQREDCAEGCSYAPAQCYCAPDVTCVCGGGPPALCLAA